MKYKKWAISVIALILSALLAVSSFVFAVDPLTHYHAPWFALYPLVENERYHNPGIAKNIQYDSVLVGSSMVQNSKVSDFNKAMSCTTVKLSFAAGSLCEYNKIINLSYKKHKLKNVFWGLDVYSLMENVKDDEDTLNSLPQYLYDENPFNDVNYLLNYDILKLSVRTALKMSTGGEEYLDNAYYFADKYKFGKKYTLEGYSEPEKEAEKSAALYEESCKELVNKNIVSLVESHPETTFWFFFPPYSVLTWNNYKCDGRLRAALNAKKVAYETLCKFDNVKIFDFQQLTDITGDLELYKDFSHYNPDINSAMVSWMAEGKCEIKNEEQMINSNGIIYQQAIKFNLEDEKNENRNSD